MPEMAQVWWQKEPNPRLQGSHDLDSGKVQAPCIVRLSNGHFRLFYTAVGPAKPFADCQGYILSAYSADGLNFRKEPGIRVAPQPQLAHLSLRVLAPSIVAVTDKFSADRFSQTGYWRMYFEARGPADRPTVICSATSCDLLNWQIEAGVRLETEGGVGAPRYLQLANGQGRMYCCRSEYGPGGTATGQRVSTSVISAISSDGLNFEIEPGYRLQDRQSDDDSAGISAAEVLAPDNSDSCWTMFYSAWQDVAPGTMVPVHPSLNPAAVSAGQSKDFAAASIASDMAGYRSRIFHASSIDGLNWHRHACVLQGEGYGRPGLDAVHAEDMSVIRIGTTSYRMYYAACDTEGNWRIASAVTSTQQTDSGTLIP